MKGYPQIRQMAQMNANAGVWGGIHVRSATDTGEAMGRQFGELAARRIDGSL